MKITDIFKSKKEKRKVEKQIKEAQKAQTHTESYSYEEACKFNDALFARYHADMEKGTLPTFPAPTAEEIAKCISEKSKRMPSAYDDPSALRPDMEILKENNAIPAEVDIWVNKVCDYYFADMKHVFGRPFPTAGVKKELYKLKGYEWHTAKEIYPSVHFD